MTDTLPTPPTGAILAEPRLTPKEAAPLLGYRCTKSVLRLIAAGELAPIFRRAKRGIGAIEIPQSTITAFNAKKLVGAGGSAP